MDLLSCLSTALVLSLVCQLKLIESLPEKKNPMKRSLGAEVDYASADWDRAPRKDEVPVLLENEATEKEENESPTTLIPLQSYYETGGFSEAAEDPDEVRDVREGLLKYDLPVNSSGAPTSDPKNIISFDIASSEEDFHVFAISTTLSPTPMVDFQSKALLAYDQDCQVYGEHINEAQWSTEPLVEKKKKLGGEETVEYFGTQICNFIPFNLECVPNDRRTIFTPPPPKQASDPNDPNTPVEDDEDPVFMPKPKGKCKCLRALGEKAFWFKVSTKDQSKCVIPADQGIHSNCGFDISFPYGEILDTATSTKRSFTAARACTENSNCTTGYTYTGLRCHCNKGTQLLPSGKCVDSSGRKVHPDIAVGKNQSSISNNVERPSRSLESILEGLTALDPLAASFGAPTTSLTSPSEGSLDGSLQDTYPEQHPEDLQVSRRPSSSSSYTSSRSEFDLFDKEPVSHGPSSSKYHPSQGNHRSSQISSDPRQKAQDELFANFPVLPYPPAFLAQMPPSPPHQHSHNQNHKTSGEGRIKQEESEYQTGSLRGQDRYPDDDLPHLDYHNNTYSPTSSHRSQHRYEDENLEGHHHHTSLSKDENTPFYPSHGIQSPHEVRLPIYSPYSRNNMKAPSATPPATSSKSPTREPYYYQQSPSSTEDNRSFSSIRLYGRGKQEVSHVPSNENQDGLEILPGLQFRGYHSGSNNNNGGASLSSPASYGHHYLPPLQGYPEEGGPGNNKPVGNSGNNQQRDLYYREHYGQAVNHLTHGERPVANYASYHQDNQVYGVRENPSSSTHPHPQLHQNLQNYSPNHGYRTGAEDNGHFNFEGDRRGSTGGHHQTLGSYPVYAYPTATASGGQASHLQVSHGYGYGHSAPVRVNDYKAHETAVNAAALQALQSIQGLDRDASYSFTGLGSPASPYGSLGSSLSGLYR